MGLYVPFAPSLLGAFFFLSFNFLFSICYALLSCTFVLYLSDMPNKVVKKKKLLKISKFSGHFKYARAYMRIGRYAPEFA